MATIDKKLPDGVSRGDAATNADFEKLGSPHGDNILAAAGGEDILALQDLDLALNMKMHLVNNVGLATNMADMIEVGVNHHLPYRQLTKSAGLITTGSYSFSMALGMRHFV